MERSFKRYVGATVNLIYFDRKGSITQRKVVVWSVDDGFLEGYCLLRNARRMFKVEQILAVMPVSRVGRHA